MKRPFVYREPNTRGRALVGLLFLGFGAFVWMTNYSENSALENMGAAVGFAFIAYFMRSDVTDLILNPSYGILIDDKNLILNPDSKATKIPLADIAYVEVGSDEGRTTLKIFIKSGPPVKAQFESLPAEDVLRNALSERNIFIRKPKSIFD